MFQLFLTRTLGKRLPVLDMKNKNENEIFLKRCDKKVQFYEPLSNKSKREAEIDVQKSQQARKI